MTKLWRTDFGGAIRNALGISGRELHKQWIAALEERYRGREEEISAMLAEGDLVSKEGYFNLHPTWSPDGKKLAYLSNKGSDYGRTSLFIHTLEDSSDELVAGGATTAIDWSPDGSNLLFSRRSTPNKYSSRLWDIYTVDPSRKDSKGIYQNTKETLGLSTRLPANEKRLSRNLRAIHPAYSKDGTRIAFAKNGGNMGETGSVSFMFDRVGEIMYPASVGDADRVMLAAIEAGAEDIESDDEGHWIYCTGNDLNDVATALEAALGESETEKLIWKPQAPTEIADMETAQKLMKLIETLEDDDDVQNVTGNFDFSDEVATRLEG